MDIELNKLDSLKQLNIKKYKAVILKEEGKSLNFISKQLNMDKTQLKGILSKFEQYGSAEVDLRKSNEGRKKLINESNKEQFMSIISQQESKSFKALKTVIQTEMEIDCSDSTLRRALKQEGRFLKPQWVPNLSQNKIESRLIFCKEHIRRRSGFKNIIFTDECRFYLNRQTKKVFVFKGQKQPSKAKQNPDYSVLIWAAICNAGKLNIQIIEETINSNVYSKILQNFINDEESKKILKTKQWYFMQDIAPAHRPKIHKNFLLDNGFKIHSHPANSPDFNPIETIWSYLKQDLEQYDPKNKVEIKDAILRSWRNLDMNLIQNCISHLKQYIKKVRGADGAYVNE